MQQMNGAQAQSVDLFAKAMAAMGAITGNPVLYGPNGKPLVPTSNFTYRRDAAKNVGSFKNWRPQAIPAQPGCWTGPARHPKQRIEP